MSEKFPVESNLNWNQSSNSNKAQVLKHKYRLKVHAEGLANMDFFGLRKSDPYLVVKLEQVCPETPKTNLKLVGQSEFLRNNSNPDWKPFEITEIPDLKTKLLFEVYDKDRYSKDDLIGSFKRSLEQIKFELGMHCNLIRKQKRFGRVIFDNIEDITVYSEELTAINNATQASPIPAPLGTQAPPFPVPLETIIIDKNLPPISTDSNSVKSVNVKGLLWKYALKAEGIGMRYDRRPVLEKTPVLGSEENVYFNGDYGFFSAVIKAYNHHLVLDTTPEDWFYTIVHKIAVAVDSHSEDEVVRDFFVDHEGKKTLTVIVPNAGPMEVDYTWFIDQMTKQIDANIKRVGYVKGMTANFSTSTANHKIVSGITVMASVQEFFDYGMGCGCGIPAVKMRGSLEDWEKLKFNIVSLEAMMEPIQKAIGLSSKWWRDVANICENLIKTYQQEPDLAWWHSIICKTTKEEWGPSGTNRREVPAYNGWFITKLLGLKKVKSFTEIGSGLVSVPMKITKPGQKEESSAFVAGISGYKIEKCEKLMWQCVSSVHAWTLLLEPNSAFRNDFPHERLSLQEDLLSLSREENDDDLSDDELRHLHPNIALNAEEDDESSDELRHLHPNIALNAEEDDESSDEWVSDEDVNVTLWASRLT